MGRSSGREQQQLIETRCAARSTLITVISQVSQYFHQKLRFSEALTSIPYSACLLFISLPTAVSFCIFFCLVVFLKHHSFTAEGDVMSSATSELLFSYYLHLDVAQQKYLSFSVSRHYLSTGATWTISGEKMNHNVAEDVQG